MSTPATSSAIPSSSIHIKFPEEKEDLPEVLLDLSRQIEKQYASLPWPAKMQNIVVLTHVCGGRGDIAAAAKAIGVMQQMCPTLTFDWVLQGGSNFNPASFLTCADPSKVHIRNWQSSPPSELPGDFLLSGPVQLCWGANYIESRIMRKTAGPTFCFLENAHDLNSFNPKYLPLFIKEGKSSEENYRKLHSDIFSSKRDGSNGDLRMGLDPGSGIFLDRSRIEAPRSRGYCCPSYLLQIQDAGLRGDILKAMHSDETSAPDYDRHSFNFGYAHHAASWGKFIDCIAIHEGDKDVVIVLNKHGEFTKLSSKEFCDQILTPERIAFLKEKGYSKVIFKGEEEPSFAFEAEESQAKKCLTVIVRSSFTPGDMKQMQLAAERLLGTGDNSAVEAWCARCRLYLYEDVSNAGCKWRFLQQQVDLAKTISPNLSKLLAIFGGDKRLADRCLNQPLSKSQMAEVEKLLNDPNLSKDTLQLCDLITKNFSFAEALESALKRTAWHHLVPELPIIEAEVLGEEFQAGLISYIQNSKDSNKNLVVQDLSRLEKRVQEAVAKYL